LITGYKQQIRIIFLASFSFLKFLLNTIRLFVANVGPINCFVCLVDKEDKYKLKVVPLQTDHSLANIDEVMRLIKIKADITDLDQNHLAIKYTRCLGN
jgi:hypothetical protein